MYLDIRNQMQTVAESRVIIPFANIYRTEYSHFLFGRYQKYNPAQDIFSYWDFILSFYCLPDCGHCPTLMHQLIVVEFYQNSVCGIQARNFIGLYLRRYVNTMPVEI